MLGVRPLERIIQKIISDPISQLLIYNNLKSGDSLTL